MYLLCNQTFDTCDYYNNLTFIPQALFHKENLRSAGIIKITAQ